MPENPCKDPNDLVLRNLYPGQNWSKDSLRKLKRAAQLPLAEETYIIDLGQHFTQDRDCKRHSNGNQRPTTQGA